jgi:transcription initiation factor IIE alpha subunit
MAKAETKSVTIIVLDEKHCAIDCPFLRNDTFYHCVLFNMKLSYDSAFVYRTGRCMDKK